MWHHSFQPKRTRLKKYMKSTWCDNFSGQKTNLVLCTNTINITLKKGLCKQYYTHCFSIFALKHISNLSVVRNSILIPDYCWPQYSFTSMFLLWSQSIWFPSNQSRHAPLTTLSLTFFNHFQTWCMTFNQSGYAPLAIVSLIDLKA